MGFLQSFTKLCFEIIKQDLMNMFQNTEWGELVPFLLNYGTIILISKKENAIQIQQYRTICLLNVSSNIFTNIDTNILEYSDYTHTNCFHAMEAYTGRGVKSSRDYP
jgi:hypothetical protein